MINTTTKKSPPIRCKNREEVFLRYLQVVNGLVNPTNRLTDGEMALMAYLCTQNPDVDHLKGMAFERTRQHFPKCSTEALAVFKSKLKKKGWLVDGLITNRIRPQLKELYLKKDLPYTEISLNLTFTDKTVEQMLNEE